MNRFARTRSLKCASHPVAGRAQCSVGSIDDDGMRYGLTTHALSASTMRIAPPIVMIQSRTTRTPCGSPGAMRPSGSLTGSPDVLPAPALDPRVVAGEQDVRHLPAAKLGRARVVRVLEPAAELLAEALELAAPLGERTRQPARHRVEQDHRGQVAVREDVRTDRDGIAREMLDDPLVEPFEASGQERQVLLFRELL